jgi:hypothetical protein
MNDIVCEAHYTIGTVAVSVTRIATGSNNPTLTRLRQISAGYQSDQVRDLAINVVV